MDMYDDSQTNPSSSAASLEEGAQIYAALPVVSDDLSGDMAVPGSPKSPTTQAMHDGSTDGGGAEVTPRKTSASVSLVMGLPVRQISNSNLNSNGISSNSSSISTDSSNFDNSPWMKTFEQKQLAKEQPGSISAKAAKDSLKKGLNNVASGFKGLWGNLTSTKGASGSSPTPRELNRGQ